MAPNTLHAHERDELSRIDYFLDQLARAVERGEVPRESYDTLAPRYLARRADVVAVLTVGQPPADIPTPRAALDAAPQASPSPHPRRDRTPVKWTTVLLFLGAFLVIVASAIFSLAVWDIASPGFKLAFLGALTVAFYVAGGYARTKLDLRAGSTALTVVGSAMLLFDCWIVIDGFHLQSIPSWSAALFVCSAVYWFTEVRLGERFYGIAGAAAQIGWWWLLGAGMHLEYPLRFAGVALVALLWQLTAERVDTDSPFASLAHVLEWAAPVVEAGAAVALFANLALMGAPDSLTLFAVVASAGAAAIVAWRTRLALGNRGIVAALAQVPLLFACLLSAENPGWVLVATLVAMTAVYTLTSLLGAGARFAILALVSESAFVGVTCDLLNVDAHVTAVVFAVLAVTWVLASRYAFRLAGDTAGTLAFALPGADELSRVAGIGGTAMLVLSSAMAIAGGAGIALTGILVAPEDAVTASCVLVAWALATIVGRTRRDAVLTSLWSLYVLAAVLSWGLPGVQSASYALALLVGCAAWFWARNAMQRFYHVDAQLSGWLYRGIALLIVAGGLAAQEYFFANEPAWASAFLALAAAIFYATDAGADGPDFSAYVAGVAGTGAAFIAGNALAVQQTPTTGALAVLAASPASFAAVAAAGGATAMATAAASLRKRYVRVAGPIAVAATVSGTCLVVVASDDPARAALALALMAVAWAAASVAQRVQAFAGIAGFSAFASVIAVIAAVEGPPWVTVVVVAAVCGVLNLPALTRRAGPNGDFDQAGLALAAAGLVGILAVAVLGEPASLSADQFGQTNWLAFGLHGEAALLAVAGAIVLAQAVRRKSEVALYVGFGVMLVALWTETHALSVTTTELYSTPLAIYLIAMGYIYARRVPGRGVPPVLDVGSVLVGLGLPLLGALNGWGPEAFAHTAWTIGLSLAFIGGGILGRCRAYLFGGAGALALVAAWRTMTYLAEFWWLVLGVIGISMLVIALTWERQRMLLSETQQRLRDGFENWR